MKTQARKAETYRGHPDWKPAPPPPIRLRLLIGSRSKYTGEMLRKIRAVKGVGRPPK